MDIEGIPYAGEILALLSPLCWSFAIILFRRTGDVVPPFALNLFKNGLGLGLFVLSMQLLGEGAPEGVRTRDYVLLLASGAIGMGLADTLLLMCLNRIGAGRQAIVNTAYSPPIILLSAIFLGEALSALQLLGVGFILGAVLVVGMGKTHDGTPLRVLRTGVLLGVGAYLAQAVSIVMMKPFMEGWSVLWMTSWRLFGGLLALILLLPVLPPERRRLAPLLDRRIWPAMVSGSFLGTYVALLCWIAGFKYADASVASALNQTATLFTFVLAVVFLGEPVTPRRLWGLGLGIVGVCLVLAYGRGSEQALYSEDVRQQGSTVRRPGGTQGPQRPAPARPGQRPGPRRPAPRTAH